MNFVLAADGEPKIAESFLRQEELLSCIKDYVVRNLAKEKAENLVDVEEIVDFIFDLLEESGVITKKETPLSGDYFKFNQKKFANFRPIFLHESPTHRIASEIGRRYYPDVFATIHRGIEVDDPDAAGAAREESSGPSAIGILSDEVVAEIVPAADRLVTLNHNSPEHKEVSSKLDEIFQTARSDNEFGSTPAERERLLNSLEAAQALWKSAELKVIQVKVGVIQALEETQEAFREIGKAVGVGLIVDLIKRIVKDQIGIDL
ncbi:hypothetical protein [Aurantiacibacter rhizosphaerae]|uniref:Uncharacterized protein n=1 Tax=Aurantiacibacter rhizosphaerae TaxID=2691582 RepID=A0A844XDK7_9SPHN|nr:hypothetical protein [Aurantiacibacter rhizosphaerae]MWV28086.1 hypothetical protein [Aurantiacibacter rhizosphaerae]